MGWQVMDYRGHAMLWHTGSGNGQLAFMALLPKERLGVVVLVNTWAADHTMTLADGAPLIALDMYEHAYHLDYGAKAGAYVDAFMKAVSWKNANAAFRRAAG